MGKSARRGKLKLREGECLIIEPESLLSSMRIEACSPAVIVNERHLCFIRVEEKGEKDDD